MFQELADHEDGYHGSPNMVLDTSSSQISAITLDSEDFDISLRSSAGPGCRFMPDLTTTSEQGEDHHVCAAPLLRTLRSSEDRFSTGRAYSPRNNRPIRKPARRGSLGVIFKRKVSSLFSTPNRHADNKTMPPVRPSRRRSQQQGLLPEELIMAAKAVSLNGDAGAGVSKTVLPPCKPQRRSSQARTIVNSDGAGKSVASKAAW